MRFEIWLSEDEHLTCGSCAELKGDGDHVFIGDSEEQMFAVLCQTCMDLEEEAIADGIEFTGVTNPENPDEPCIVCGAAGGHDEGCMVAQEGVKR